MSRCICRQVDLDSERQGVAVVLNNVGYNQKGLCEQYFDPATALDSRRPTGVAI